MKAPTDKSNDMIQIQVTTACGLHTCSNCVYAIPFRTQQHMSVDVFREAVRSLAGWPGYICMMGGNPPAHPQFPELCAVLRQEVPDVRHRGIVMSDPLGHAALIQRTFLPHGRMLLNAHGRVPLAQRLHALFPSMRVNGLDGHAARHSPFFVHYEDMGLSRDAWEAARERCDMNAHWSAGIFERHGKPVGYFCEICGVIDDLLDEDHGVPVEPGWWRWPMAAFQHQVACCDAGCGIPLAQPGHLDCEGIHDVSGRWLALAEMLCDGTVTLHQQTALDARVANATDYMRLRGRR